MSNKETKRNARLAIVLIVGFVFGSFGLATPALAAGSSPSVSASSGKSASVPTKKVKKVVKAKAKHKVISKASKLSKKKAKIAAIAKTGSGVKYRSGGNTRKGWDCSGFVTYTYKKAGQKVSGRYTTSTLKNNKSFKKTKTPKPGDVVYQGKSHMGIYLGKQKGKHVMISARNPRAGTTVHPVYNWNGNKPVTFYALKA